MSDDQTSQDLPDRSEYLENRKSLIDMEFNLANNFDKYMLTLSAGSLGITITFCREIAKIPISCPWLLILSWAGFILAILCILVGLHKSQDCLRIRREISDLKYKQKKPENGNKELQDQILTEIKGAQNRWKYYDWWVTKLNWTAIISFVTGVILVILFTAFNFKGDS